MTKKEMREWHHARWRSGLSLTSTPDDPPYPVTEDERRRMLIWLARHAVYPPKPEDYEPTVKEAYEMVDRMIIASRGGRDEDAPITDQDRDDEMEKMTCVLVSARMAKPERDNG